MAKHRTRRRPGGGRRRGRDESEWIGGLLSPPFFITDRDEPYRPGLVVWMDARSRLVLGQDVVAPEDTQGAVVRALLVAMERPLAGPPCRPGRIRVADPALAVEIRAALGDGTPIVVAPTPELDELVELLGESLGRGEEVDSYLEQGRVPPAAVARLFAAAEVLYGLAPWQIATDGEVLRMDIPALGVEGACVSILGNLGKSRGLLIFPSLEGYEAFGLAAQRFEAGSTIEDFGTDWLALSFERGADLPAPMRREVSAQGWPVADANAYPVVERRERDCASRPLVERDVKIASACASSLAAFFAKHRSLFEAETFEAVCESWFDEDDLEVRFTLPYEAYGDFEIADAPVPSRAETPGRGRIRRNDPCPCGSGKKYKKCHRDADQALAGSRPEAPRQTAGDHDLDGRLTRKLEQYAMRRFGSEWRRFTRDFVDPEATIQLAVPWSVHQYRVQGQSVADWFRAEHGGRLTREERRWLSAQRAAWLSVWEVTAVEPGVSLTLRDLLSHEERSVREKSGSRILVVRDVLLARVVDHEGLSLVCGAHPRPLPPLEAAEVERRARGRLRRKRAVPVERLREESFGRYLIKRWEKAVEEYDLRVAIPPRLQNTDGDPLLLTTDHFRFEPQVRAEIEKRLARMEGAEFEDPEQDGSAYVFLEPGNPLHTSWENTLVGRAQLDKDGLRVETNSIRRADALRARVEEACGSRIRHRVREHSDPASPSFAKRAAGPPPEPPPPEAEQLLLEFKRRHYADWLDAALPALSGQSPREAVQTAQGRSAVDVLLKDMENQEHRFSSENGFDFGQLRRELGLE